MPLQHSGGLPVGYRKEGFTSKFYFVGGFCDFGETNLNLKLLTLKLKSSKYIQSPTIKKQISKLFPKSPIFEKRKKCTLISSATPPIHILKHNTKIVFPYLGHEF